MRLRWPSLFVLILVLLSVLPAAAQGNRFTFDDQGCSLDRLRIEAAAQPLIEKGAHVVVVCTGDAGGRDARGYLDQRLSELGVADSSRSSDLPGTAIIYFVSRGPQASAILGGSGWSLSGRAVEEVRTDTMNPQLAAGNFTEAYANAMNEMNNLITSRGTGGGPTIVETTPLATWLWACLAVAVVGVLAATLGPALLRKRRQQAAAQAAFTQARDRFNAARKAAGAAIADTSRLMQDAQLKQRFDPASYGEAAAQQLAQQQQQAEQLYGQAQHDFDDAEERIQLLRQPTTEDYQAAVGAYDAVRATVEQVRELLQQLEARRQELDRINREAAGGLDSLKKA